MDNFEKLIGSRIKKIFMNENYLRFETDKGVFIYTVEGDCCSQSVFYDFLGVKKLLSGNEVVSTKEINLSPVKEDNKNYQESISVYGFEIVTDDPNFGEVTSVVSFRNYSNGYYGGYMNREKKLGSYLIDVQPEIFDDVLETQSINS
jgi:hypothetical protein